jgi:hypothetical protein
MPKQATAPPFADDEIVVCLDGFASYPNIVVAKGTRLRASSEAVRRNPDLFCRDGLTAMEMQNLLEQRRPRREPEQHVPIMREEVELRPEDSMLCVKGVRGRHQDGDAHLAPPMHVIPAGSHVTKDHPLVKLFPDSFVPVVPAGLNRTNAVLALTDRYEYRRNADGMLIPEDDAVLRQTYGDHHRFLIHYAGTWISRSDPDVAANPSRYQLLS